MTDGERIDRLQKIPVEFLERAIQQMVPIFMKFLGTTRLGMR